MYDSTYSRRTSRAGVTRRIQERPAGDTVDSLEPRRVIAKRPKEVRRFFWGELDLGRGFLPSQECIGVQVTSIGRSDTRRYDLAVKLGKSHQQDERTNSHRQAGQLPIIQRLSKQHDAEPRQQQ